MRALPLRLLLFIIVSLLVQVDATWSKEVSGPAAIVDGDTLWVGSHEIRIHGIDAPETSQKCQLPKGTWDCSTAATDALASMTENKIVRCVGSEVGWTVDRIDPMFPSTAS
jgi:endonuclease YncB( thermonuclease family)